MLENESNGGEPGARRILIALGIFGLLLVIGGLFLPWLIYTLLGPREWSELGQRGDLYGGFLNPLLSFLAFMGVLYSIYLQRIDLRETQQETQRQQFEATFFQLMAQHNRIVEGIDIRSREHAQISGGRDCFRHFLNSLQMRISHYHNSFGPRELDRIKTGYKKFWEGNRQDLGHYYRFLYNFIRYVDEAKLPRLPYDTVEPKVKYVRIIRAQLSDYELALAFYNSLGDHGGKFKAYVGKYDLLDNLPTDIIKPQEHLEYRDGMGQVGKLSVR